MDTTAPLLIKHQETLELFASFVGYNRPEVHKHCKPSIENLSRTELHNHAVR